MDAELIAEIINNLFPAGSEPCWNAIEVEQKDRFWVIPGKEGPRWIVPQFPGYGWSVLSKWKPYDLSSRLKWAALMVAYRTGQLGLILGVVGVGVIRAADKSWSHLGWRNERSPVPTIYVGTHGQTQKAVAHLVDVSKCQPVAVAKAPLGKRSAKNILHEADILKLLEEEKPGMAPRIRYVDRTAGISLQNHIRGRSSCRGLTQAHIDWLAGLHRPMVETSLREQSERLMERLFQLEGTEEETLHLLQKLLEKINDPTPLPAFWVHGDFAPWNLRWVEEGKLAAVDWEEAQQTGLPAVDLIYFHLILGFLIFNNQPYKMWIRLQKAMNSRLVRSYIERFCFVETLFKSFVFFTIAELLIRRIMIVNPTTDQFCIYLKTLIKEPIGNL